MIRRVGRPGLIGLAARTAVVAGTASAVSGAMAGNRQRKAQSQYEQEQYEAAQQQAAMQQAAQQAVAAQQAAAPAPAAAPAVDVVAELQKLAALKDAGVGFDELRGPNGVAPLDAGAVEAVQEHVHLGERPGAADRFLPVERIPLRAAELGLHAATALHEQRAGTAGGVIHVLEASLPAGNDLGEDGADFLWGVELARFLARSASELPDEVFVSISKYVDIGILQPEVNLVEVDEHFRNELVLLVFCFT